MSVQTEIDRISNNVAETLSAIEAKGVTVAEDATSDDMAALVSGIEVATVTVYSGAAPSAEQGKDGDIFLATE